MKALFIAVTISAAACQTTSSTAVENAIPGSYVCNFYDSITATSNVKGVDSLVIKKEVASGSDSYEIKRFVSAVRTMDNIQEPVSQKIETWTGIYDRESKVLKTSPSGKILAFDMDNHVLKIDDKEYKKRE
jgi:hypothetical protein